MTRTFPQFILAFSLILMLAGVVQAEQMKPNIVIILADQWRAQATGYAGDPNLQGKTPNLDQLQRQSIDFTNAVSGMPVCTPFRASLLTGQYAQTHGLFLNDLQLPDDADTMAEILGRAGYETGFIGKWHLDGHGRRAPIPQERHQGFDYWKVLECTHDYNNSYYYEGDQEIIQHWEDYDAFAQAKDAEAYIAQRAKSEKPYALILSWGPPHNPYQSAPESFRAMFDAESIQLRPNVTDPKYKKDLAGYYAHIAALDHSLGELLATIDATGEAKNTILIFTSDHGDMIGSQNLIRKQKPWDESIRVPFLLRYPAAHGDEGRIITTPLNTPDILPTLLGLSDVGIPGSVEGRDWSTVIRSSENPPDAPALIACIAPFGEWIRKKGGKEFRGVRTARYSFVMDRMGPWLLFDNENDPYQMENLVNHPELSDVQSLLKIHLVTLLEDRKDAFLHGDEYVKQWGYTVNENGTVPYANEIPEESRIKQP
ncbi:MAG: sulfatase [Candidatus Hydrogenedentota bacterium]